MLTLVQVPEALEKYSVSISVGLEKYSEYFCRPTEIQIEYFCRGLKYSSTSYYTNFRCQTWTWNQGSSMGNDVRGREKMNRIDVFAIIIKDQD